MNIIMPQRLTRNKLGNPKLQLHTSAQSYNYTHKHD